MDYTNPEGVDTLDGADTGRGGGDTAVWDSATGEGGMRAEEG